MNKLFLLVGLLVSTLAFAEVDRMLDVSKLTQEQRASLQLQITQMAEKKNDPSSLAVTVREEASKWADLGKNVGTALVASAKEVGQGVNEFSQTPVGQVTTAIIVYKVIGKDVLKVIFGILTLIFGTAASLYVFRNMGKTDIVYENVPRFGGLIISRRVKNYRLDNEWHTAACFISTVLFCATWVVALSVIFS